MKLTIYPKARPAKFHHVIIFEGPKEGVLIHEDPLGDWFGPHGGTDEEADTIRAELEAGRPVTLVCRLEDD